MMPPFGPKPPETALQHIRSWVEAIRRRGGDVVFVRLPVSGSLGRLEEQRFPGRDEVMQQLAASGANAIDYATEPGLAKYECPDESHLDADDAQRFSSALVHVLTERKMLPPVD
jgi:hypothetical protein